MNFEQARSNMIEQQIRTWEVLDQRVLDLLAAVPREDFVPSRYRSLAFSDTSIPLGFGEVMMAPKVEARMLQMLAVEPSARILEIGTGSGYLTALLAQLAGHVYSVERIRELSVRARAILDQLRISNAALMVGDGSVGWSRYAPYQAMLVSAAAPAVPNLMVDQLALGGRLLIPIGDRDLQRLTLVQKTDQGLTTEEISACVFVPLLGRFGWPAS
ncbi:MAG: protein-L-isoaspartate(D-aspartate) O-methyltransferase [Longimicrobiales bacterium]